ncbi:tail fiber domain-containing protein [Obesumbacterium proteus]|uniref:tail fiber domain-containing protein n=1 Tax=Obesumbacterium proteus TaxID=82983 RepID=UPI002431EFC8|nr:tail fiber domain-containing protein [Obesumbacterium proteus]
MANNKVRHYRTKEAGKVPLANKLLEGEIAINLADTKIYTNVDGKIVTIGHGADATIDGNNTWTGTVKANKVVSDSAPTKNAELTRKDYVDAGDKTNADAIKANSDLIKTNADNIKVNADAIKTVDIKADTKVKKAGDTMTGILKLVQPGATSIFEIGANSQIMSDSAYKALILSPSKDTDGTIYFRPSKASGTHALQTTITGTGLTSPQVYVSSPQVNAVNALVRKDFVDGRIQDVAREHVNINGDVMTGELTVPSSLIIAGPGNRHVWFKDSAGVEKGLVYSDSSTGNLNIRANGNRLFIFGADGNFTFPGSVVGPNAVLRGSVYFDDKPQGAYETTNLSNAGNNNGTNLLRRFRSQGNSSIFHEVVQGNEVRFSHGANADASPIWKYHTQGIDIVNKLEVQNWAIGPNNMLQLNMNSTVNGEGSGLIRGKVTGGSWNNWRQRPAGLLVDLGDQGSAVNVWKASTQGVSHVAAMQVLHTTNVSGAIVKLQVHDTDYNFSANNGFTTQTSGYFGKTITTAGDLRASGGVYWGSNGAWAAQDGNIYGTQWGRFTGHSGQLAWLGGALDAVNAKASNTSDIRLKKNLEKIESATDKIQKLTGYTYDKATFIGSKESYRDAGVIAQEVQAVLPEAVNIIDLNDTPTLAVSPSAMIALLVESTKEQAEKLEKQNQLIEELMKRISKLEK